MKENILLCSRMKDKNEIMKMLKNQENDYLLVTLNSFILFYKYEKLL